MILHMPVNFMNKSNRLAARRVETVYYLATATIRIQQTAASFL